MALNALELVNRYLALWNESDAVARRLAIRELWVPDGAHYVSTREARGYLALEERVAAAHDKNVRGAGYRFVGVKNPQFVRDVVMFDWNMIHPGSTEVLAVGVEFLHVDRDRRIVSDYQFITA